jgi:phosphoadenosine phosphosulfate reductase
MSIMANTSEAAQLREEAGERSAFFESAPAGLVIAWAVERFGEKVAMASSFQDAVLIDIAVTVDPAIEVIFLDTGAHFPETLEYVETIRKRYDLNLTVTKPAAGAEQWPCGTAQCCEFRKVRPLKDALAGKEAWITGLKRMDPAVGADRLLRRELGNGQDEPVGHLERRGCGRVSGRPRDPRAPLAVPGLPVHRLRPHHPSGG